MGSFPSYFLTCYICKKFPSIYISIEKKSSNTTTTKSFKQWLWDAEHNLRDLHTSSVSFRFDFRLWKYLLPQWICSLLPLFKGMMKDIAELKAVLPKARGTAQGLEHLLCKHKASSPIPGALHMCLAALLLATQHRELFLAMPKQGVCKSQISVTPGVWASQQSLNIWEHPSQRAMTGEPCSQTSSGASQWQAMITEA